MNFIRKSLAIIVSLLSMLLFIPVIIPGLFLWVIFFLTKIINHFLQPKYQPWKDLIKFDATVGWKPAANLDTYYISPDNEVCHIITDGQGWIGKNSLSETDIVVFGDSYAFGFGVNIDDSYIESEPDLRIKAIGAPGYNMVQELILMRQLSSKLTGKLVVWFICISNDLFDNLRPDKPNFYRTPFISSINGGAEWEIITNHVKSMKWPYPTLKRPYGSMFAKFCMQGPLSEHIYSSCHFLIREGSDLCEEAGARLVVMTIPRKSQLSDMGKLGRSNIACHLVNTNEEGINPDYPDQRFGDICSKLGVPFYSAGSFLNLKDYKVHDVHWTKQGNGKVAKFLADLYNDYISGSLNTIKEYSSAKQSFKKT